MEAVFTVVQCFAMFCHDFTMKTATFTERRSSFNERPGQLNHSQLGSDHRPVSLEAGPVEGSSARMLNTKLSKTNLADALGRR